jgi:hypothetical protein
VLSTKSTDGESLIESDAVGLRKGNLAEAVLLGMAQLIQFDGQVTAGDLDERGSPGGRTHRSTTR